MALKFTSTKGKAAKSVDALDVKDGDNVVRLVGGVLARYVYWLKTPDGKNIAIECLAFDREQEKFDNRKEDPVREAMPGQKCSWAYAVQCIINPNTDAAAIKTFNLKKKLFQQILTAAEDLGDPTDPETGWDVYFKKVKTGSHAFEVEYTLQVIKCGNAKRALTDLERKLVSEMKSIDEVYPRPTVDQIKQQLAALESSPADDVPPEVGDGSSDDLP